MHSLRFKKTEVKFSKVKHSFDSREVAVHVAIHVWPRTVPGQMPFFPCVFRLLPPSEHQSINCLVGLDMVDIGNAMRCDRTRTCVTSQRG